MIYTSYFAHYKGQDGVAITLGAPWYKGQTYKDLAPSADLLNWWKSLETITEDEIETYTLVYTDTILAKLDVHQVAKDLDNKVLLCFEKSGRFCHRQIVAKWLEEAGYECKELA